MFGGTEDRMGISTQHVPDCPLGIVFVFALNCIYNYYRELLPKSREYNAEGLAQGIARSVIRNIETSVSSMRPPAADSCQARNKDFFRSNQTLVSGPYQIIVADAADAVSVNFSGRCKFLQI